MRYGISKLRCMTIIKYFINNLWRQTTPQQMMVKQTARPVNATTITAATATRQSTNNQMSSTKRNSILRNQNHHQLRQCKTDRPSALRKMVVIMPLARPQADLWGSLSAGLDSWWLASRLKLACLRFLARDSILSIYLARYMLSPIRPSIRPSITRVDQSKWLT